MIKTRKFRELRDGEKFILMPWLDEIRSNLDCFSPEYFEETPGILEVLYVIYMKIAEVKAKGAKFPFNAVRTGRGGLVRIKPETEVLQVR